MKAQIVNDIILAYGIVLIGEDVYEPIPEDYSPQKYDYIPAIIGIFDPNGFVIKPDYIEPENYIL